MENCEQKADVPVIVTMTFRRPEHERELRLALNAHKYLSVLWELDNWLRNEVKHGEDGVKAEHLQEVRSRLHEWLEFEGVSLEDG